MHKLERDKILCPVSAFVDIIGWMAELDDQQLLWDFAGTRSEAAFDTLVTRYVNLVYSTALRFAGNPQLAEEITQAVFIILARKAGGLPRGTVLSGWLYQTARLTAANVRKSEIRRQRREQEACMQSTLNEPEPAPAWEQIAPLLDEAMGRLGETDRTAVVLRFFENKTAREVAAALRLTEAAAHKRVNRALDRLQKLFSKRGVNSTASAIAENISAHSIQAAPALLAKTVTTMAISKGATASLSTLTLIKGALKLMAWTKAKTAIVAGAAIILAATTGVVVVSTVMKASPSKLQMRTLKVNSRIFLVNLWQAAKSPASPNVTNLFPVYLASKGINLLPPETMAFNDSRGLLFVKATASDLNAIEKIVVQLNHAPAQVHLKASFIEVPETEVPAVLKAGTAINTTNDNSLEILDDAQAGQLLRLLKKDRSDILAEPQAVTLAGEQTSMRAGNATIDFVSTLLDDNFTLKIKISAGVSDTFTADACIWDGQTLAIGSPKSNGQSRLFIFAAVRLVDPAGNAVHSAAELAKKAGTIPPQ